VRTRIVATTLPGRTFCEHANVHVGVQRKPAAGETPNSPAGQVAGGLVPGDAGSAVWDIELDVVDGDSGPDFRGPYVQGKKGDRFVYLSWGNVGADGSFEMFRRAKLMLGGVDAKTLQLARDGGCLTGTLDLTGTDGTPVCAAIRPPRITWTAE
jgi:hypothetical protein